MLGMAWLEMEQMCSNSKGVEHSTHYSNIRNEIQYEETSFHSVIKYRTSFAI
jgi:hypothetical protein